MPDIKRKEESERLNRGFSGIAGNVGSTYFKGETV
jgi:hypothetical protein